MSTNPSPTDPVGTSSASVSHNKGNSLIEPMGAGYKVDYIMDVKLQTKDGTDIPLHNHTLSFKDDGFPISHVSRKWGDKSERFNQEEEDYWLLYVHLNHADMGIAIGGETPVLVNAKPNWKSISSEETRSINITNACKNTFKLSYRFEDEANGDFNQFVAVRCPKMDNPAITVKTTGHYAGLHWVGLFVKTATDDTNRFIAARTTNRLLPDYAERIRTYKNFDQWYNEDGQGGVHPEIIKPVQLLKGRIQWNVIAVLPKGIAGVMTAPCH